MIGALLLLPGELVPRGTWLIGAGLILLGLNLIRYLSSIRASTFTVLLGAVSIILGLATFFGLKLPLFALFLIIIGAVILLKSLFANRD